MIYDNAYSERTIKTKFPHLSTVENSFYDMPHFNEWAEESSVNSFKPSAHNYINHAFFFPMISSLASRVHSLIPMQQ